MTGSPRCGQPSPAASASRWLDHIPPAGNPGAADPVPVLRRPVSLHGSVRVELALDLADKQLPPLTLGLLDMGPAPAAQMPGHLLQRRLRGQEPVPFDPSAAPDHRAPPAETPGLGAGELRAQREQARGGHGGPGQSCIGIAISLPHLQQRSQIGSIDRGMMSNRVYPHTRQARNR